MNNTNATYAARLSNCRMRSLSLEEKMTRQPMISKLLCLTTLQSNAMIVKEVHHYTDQLILCWSLPISLFVVTSPLTHSVSHFPHPD